VSVRVFDHLRSMLWSLRKWLENQGYDQIYMCIVDIDYVP
jgi:hypothetical protein